MRHQGAVPHREHKLVIPDRWRKSAPGVVRRTLIVSGVLAVVLGLIVWPGNVVALKGLHGLAGWVMIASLWTMAVFAARAGVSRGTVVLAVGGGLTTLLLGVAQHQLQPGTSTIIVLHAAAGVGAMVLGRRLVTRMRHDEAAAGTSPQQAIAIKDAAAEFLAKKRIAVTGVSRKPVQHGSNIVYRRLRERGYEVFAVNPNADEIEGDRCFHDLRSIPGGVDAVVIATRAETAMSTVQECADLGIKHVWMHRSIGAGSVSEEAAAWARQRGIRVIAGGCPLMFDPAADPGHKVMRSLFTLTGKVPRRV